MENKCNVKEYPWMLGPFCKENSVNPCLGPKRETTFFCPVHKKEIHWEEKDVFNPTAVVKDDKVYMLYRAEDMVGSCAGTSRIGIAISEDGLHFSTEAQPVLYPEQDECLHYEWDGGCEDPRIVERKDGVYVMLYTSYDVDIARLCAAESTDLYHWKKHGPVFAKALDGKYLNVWSKSGAVVCSLENDKFIAKKIGGVYWMYWGESNIYAATSSDLIHWEPVEFLADGASESVLYPVISTRKGNYDEELCEPGPQALITADGIVLLYNGKGQNPKRIGGHDTIYKAGQILLDKENPLCLLARTKTPFFEPTEVFEIEGQVMPVCFIEGLVKFKGKYFLYYGTADSHIAVATWEE